MVYWIIFMLLMSPVAYCLEDTVCFELEEEYYPALIYTVGSTLQAAYWDGDQFTVQEIMENGKYAKPVGDRMYFVSNTNYRRLYNYFVIDLNRGRITRIEYDEPLRFIGAAYGECLMFYQSKNSDDDLAFYRFDLKTFALQPLIHYTHKDNPDWFNDLSYRFKISPDCRYLASLRYRAEKREVHPKPANYDLSITDLYTNETKMVDDEVGIVISFISSSGRGYPPFEWLDDDELMYLDMDMDKATIGNFGAHDFITEVSSTLKIAAVSPLDITITEHGDYDLPLTINGGSFVPSKEQILYEDYRVNWEVDQKNKVMVQQQEPYEISRDRNTRDQSIQYFDQQLYQGELQIHDKLTSLSKKNFAYVLRKSGNPGEHYYSLYIAQKGGSKPIPIIEHTRSSIQLIEWFE
jgi:hypothetical protein